MRTYSYIMAMSFLVLVSSTAMASSHHEQPAQVAQEVTAPVTAKSAWEQTMALQEKIAQAISANDAPAIHNLTSQMGKSLEHIRVATADLSEARRTRLHAAITQADKAAKDLHEAADKNDTALTVEKQTRLQSALRLVEALGANF